MAFAIIFVRLLKAKALSGIYFTWLPICKVLNAEQLAKAVGPIAVQFIALK
jgi:hypothetical protein